MIFCFFFDVLDSFFHGFCFVGGPATKKRWKKVIFWWNVSFVRQRLTYFMAIFTTFYWFWLFLFRPKIHYFLLVRRGIFSGIVQFCFVLFRASVNFLHFHSFLGLMMASIFLLLFTVSISLNCANFLRFLVTLIVHFLVIQFFYTVFVVSHKNLTGHWSSIVATRIIKYPNERKILDVNRSNDFKQMTGDHSDECGEIQKKTLTKEKKKKRLFEWNQHQRHITWLCVSISLALHVFTCRSLARRKFECVFSSLYGMLPTLVVFFFGIRFKKNFYEWSWKFTARLTATTTNSGQIFDPKTTAIYFTIDKYARDAVCLLRGWIGAFNWHDCIRRVKLINYGLAKWELKISSHWVFVGEIWMSRDRARRKLARLFMDFRNYPLLNAFWMRQKDLLNQKARLEEIF